MIYLFKLVFIFYLPLSPGKGFLIVVIIYISLLFSFQGKYKTQLYDENIRDFLPSSPGIGMHVEVKDPNMKIILSKYYASEGRFTFTSHSPGEHLICLHSNSTRWSLWAGGKLVSESNSVVKGNSFSECCFPCADTLN